MTVQKLLGSMTLVLALPLASAAAQAAESSAQTLAPARPDSVLTASPKDTAFKNWRSEVREHGRFGASFLVFGQRYQVLVVTPMALDVLAADSLVVQHARGCQAALQYSDEVVDAATRLRPWIEFDSAASARPTVAFTILPADPVRMDCSRGQLAQFAAITRGAVFGVPPAYNPIYDAINAEVRRDGELVPPVLTGSASIRKHATAAIVEDETKQVRVYVPVDAFAPYDDGRPSELSLFVWSPADEAADILRVPPELVRAVWAQYQPWRARQLGHDGTVPAEALTLAFAPPRDTVMLRAHNEYIAGDFGRATSTVLGRLVQWPLPSRPDMRDGMLISAATFVAYGNDEDATSLLKDVLEYYPCLTMAANAPEEMNQILNRARSPRARCTSKSLPLVALAGVVPGGGQLLMPERRQYGRSLLLWTLGGFAAAQGMHAYSRSAYQHYLDFNATRPPSAGARFRLAERTRIAGNVLTIGAMSLWAYAAAEAVVTEWRHKRSILEERDIGAPGGLRVAPMATGNGVGLTVGFK